MRGMPGARGSREPRRDGDRHDQLRPVLGARLRRRAILPLAVLVGAVAEIVRVSRLPVSVDVEAGYSAEPQRVADTVRR